MGTYIKASFSITEKKARELITTKMVMSMKEDSIGI
jgi:hypothetical protein